MTESIIKLKGIRKVFDGKEALKDINLYIKEKEFVTFLGPSGCGKTTTLRIIGGFENSTDGELYFEDKEISKVPPHQRQINTVFQKYALFPHLDVYENIAFGLRIKKTPKEAIEPKIKKMLKLVNLEGFEKRSVNSLSGGQQQRIAIARALVNEPKVLLLDEPLGALDLKLRKEMQYELKTMQQELGITFIYVTHDQEEALTMSDRIVVMSEGEIQQIGTPEDIYNEPVNRFVADFIGESNIIQGVMEKDFRVILNGEPFECLDKGFSHMEEVDVVIRPEDILITKPEGSKITGEVTDVVFKGVHYEIIVVDSKTQKEWMIHTINHSDVGAIVGLDFVPEALHIMKRGE
ncbi:spermidine/putrescine transport system ATP-binding protein [Acetoanaerobium pronyense]|uniref:Spermidine/putrescine import ATP-binding protein PotA n=1 Tax=Acetoanaerobium pronyense TaxID=1482736 RepID=A0ABS4KF37_9FIRM|nr:spermidine/putrescine ABC transporter ATP-binding protein [Acetoanaerobium pronyense]MBP2026387.1 spermidine/putrescine transport system ATP-binding protein [Acetoanaerobium pronyense]